MTWLLRFCKATMVINYPPPLPAWGLNHIKSYQAKVFVASTASLTFAVQVGVVVRALFRRQFVVGAQNVVVIRRKFRLIRVWRVFHAGLQQWKKSRPASRISQWKKSRLLVTAIRHKCRTSHYVTGQLRRHLLLTYLLTNSVNQFIMPTISDEITQQTNTHRDAVNRYKSL